jgi:DNA-binding HxlR family transcriptional regulator
MSPISHAILRDLTSGQSTSDSIAGRIGISEQITTANLRTLLADGYVSTIPIRIAGKDALTVYRLTAKPIL